MKGPRVAARPLWVKGSYDGPATGIARFQGRPHFYRRERDEDNFDVPDKFWLYPLTTQEARRERLAHWVMVVMCGTYERQDARGKKTGRTWLRGWQPYWSLVLRINWRLTGARRARYEDRPTVGYFMMGSHALETSEKKEERLMKTEIVTMKALVKAEAQKLHDWKKWDRRAPELKTDPRPTDPGNELRATIFCMTLAHIHGRLHCRTVWGKDSRRVELNSLADQKKFVEDQLGKRWSPIKADEAATIRALLEWTREAATDSPRAEDAA